MLRKKKKQQQTQDFEEAQIFKQTQIPYLWMFNFFPCRRPHIILPDNLLVNDFFSKKYCLKKSDYYAQ